MFRFRQMRSFFKARDPPRCFIEAAPVLQVILAVRGATSGAALTGVAVLEAAPEVAKTNGLYNKLINSGFQAFSLMHILEGRGLRDAIAVTYSDGKSRFCRPFQWRGTGASMVA